MANIGLIDVDGRNYPNLALMKISSYHKSIGDNVEWAMPLFGAYDRVYKSKVFSFTPDDNTAFDCDVVNGGTGYAIKLVNGKEVYMKSNDIPLADEVEHQYPDYSLYPQYTDNKAYGFLTRGCPRGCGFCHVAPKEGRHSYKVANLNEFWRGQKEIVLNDPNILACKDWGELFEQLIRSKSNVDFNQGLDIRLMTEDKIEAINQVKVKEIHFAWDNYHDKDKVLPKFELFSRLSLKKQHAHNSIVYTLVNYNSTIDQDLERIYTLRDLGYWAYVMIYDKEHCPPIYKKMQRWVNNRFIFATCKKFEDYIDSCHQSRNSKLYDRTLMAI